MYVVRLVWRIPNTYPRRAEGGGRKFTSMSQGNAEMPGNR
jgi:hypothetical protein